MGVTCHGPRRQLQAAPEPWCGKPMRGGPVTLGGSPREADDGGLATGCQLAVTNGRARAVGIAVWRDTAQLCHWGTTTRNRAAASCPWRRHGARVGREPTAVLLWHRSPISCYSRMRLRKLPDGPFAGSLGASSACSQRPAAVEMPPMAELWGGGGVCLHVSGRSLAQCP